ncbi:hypothetical protein [Micromonospora tarensis]|uniref:Uncharacterized protein n=1 Tax=Micromonospora tarensis TaxID=2806100 RepID=A0ABS1YS33_9ACTN|nr:hypothetical protein [Micromonospora tarensis]MBM0280092.1 hypothetical protein [Micromonospora tarensis]
MASDATAYPHRHQDTLIVASTFPPQGGAALDAAWRAAGARADGAYVNFESRPGPAAFARIYPGETGARVRRLWQRYDPDGVFRSALLTGQSSRSDQGNRRDSGDRAGQAGGSRQASRAGRAGRTGQPHRRRR